MKNATAQQEHIKTVGIPPQLAQRIYKLHLQGALVQTGAIVAIWSVLLFSHIFSIIDTSAFTGVTITGIVVILINIPFLCGLKKITTRPAFEIYNLSINIFEALAYTVIVYFLGGIRGMYLILIYACLISYIGISAPRRYPFIVSGACVDRNIILRESLEQLGNT